MAVKAIGQDKAVTSRQVVDGAIGVHHTAAAVDDVAKLGVARAVRAEGASRGFPDAAAQRPGQRAKAFECLVGGVAMQRAAGFAWLGVAQVLGFDTNQMVGLSHRENRVINQKEELVALMNQRFKNV